jgi:hypothetical protein
LSKMITHEKIPLYMLVTALLIITILSGQIFFGSINYGSSAMTLKPIFGQPDGGSSDSETPPGQSGGEESVIGSECYSLLGIVAIASCLEKYINDNTRQESGMGMCVDGAPATEPGSCDFDRSKCDPVLNLYACQSRDNLENKPKQTYDWNEEDRQICQKVRVGFYAASCLVIKWLTEWRCNLYSGPLHAAGCKMAGEGAASLCAVYGWNRIQGCVEDYPPDHHYKPKPPPFFDPPFLYPWGT